MTKLFAAAVAAVALLAGCATRSVSISSLTVAGERSTEAPADPGAQLKALEDVGPDKPKLNEARAILGTWVKPPGEGAQASLVIGDSKIRMTCRCDGGGHMEIQGYYNGIHNGRVFGTITGVTVTGLVQVQDSQRFDLEFSLDGDVLTVERFDWEGWKVKGEHWWLGRYHRAEPARLTG